MLVLFIKNRYINKTAHYYVLYAYLRNKNSKIILFLCIDAVLFVKTIIFHSSIKKCVLLV